MDFNRNLWIGLTGGIATGKSSVSACLKKKGFPVIDADAISHSLLQADSPAIFALVQAFGRYILNDDCGVARPKLGAIVFADPEKLKILNSIMHPLVRDKTLTQKKILVKQGHQIIFNDVPLLYENNLQSTYDLTVVIYCSRECQILRLQKRNGFSLPEIENRLNSQLDIEWKAQQADYVIDNGKTFHDLEHHVDQFLLQVKKDRS